MLPASLINSVTSISRPALYDIDWKTGGLHIRRVKKAADSIVARLTPFKSRGENYRRVVATCLDDENIVLEFVSFREIYEPPITAVIRAKEASFQAGHLTLKNSSYKITLPELQDFKDFRERVHEQWQQGIKYVAEQRNGNNAITREGLRTPQLGALHAIASHWTINKDPALIVMPTGTGKTEVMMAACVAAGCNRVLVIVPTDALRQQTADKFLVYGWLKKIGVIDNVLNPIVGTLSSQPGIDQLDGFKACNVVVATMASIGRADEALQKQFASLFSHVIFDEAHHAEATSWKRFQKHCSHAALLLLTATPFREDKKPLEGKIIYNFPLSAAQDQKYFQPIHFLDVFEPDATKADLRIAERAVEQLVQDLRSGYNHILLARASRIEDAVRLYNEIYAANYPQLKPALIYSDIPQKKKILESIKAGEHKIIVCVDMFGEGFDLPNLKVAALHSIHKSLGITLQFIGRFARTSGDVGPASFVANTAEDGVPEALEGLYQDDADWNFLLSDLSYDAINPRAQLSELVSNLKAVGSAEKQLEISMLALRPKTSAQVYKTTSFKPENYAKAFRSSQKIHQPQISRHDNLLVLIVNQKEALDWTDSRDISEDIWDLYIAYYNSTQQLLYIHTSKKNAPSSFAAAISESPQKVVDEEVFKAFAGLRRLVIYSVGLSSRSKNVRYQMFAGLDVGNAIDPVLQQDKMKSVITGVGYEEGVRKSVGCSRKGKFWSMVSGSLSEWKAWCDELGQKLINTDIGTDDFLRFTLVPTAINALPDQPALMVDWPDQLFESAAFKFVAHVDGKSYGFHDCQLNLIEWGNKTNFKFSLQAGESIEVVMELILTPREKKESIYRVEKISGPDVQVEAVGTRSPIADFFTENAPLVRFSDGSQLSGNILLKPKEALEDTYDRNLVRTLDWGNTDFSKESRWKNKQIQADSIQQHFIRHLENGLSRFIIDDDDNGESADIISIDETADTITVHLWHCKYSGGSIPGARVDDLYEVCGQAQKSVKWTWGLSQLVKHLLIRESDSLRGRTTRFIRGTPAELITLRKAARRKYVSFKIGIVQPGFSKANAPANHLTIVGATNSFVQCITNNSLIVYGSE